MSNAVGDFGLVIKFRLGDWVVWFTSIIATTVVAVVAVMLEADARWYHLFWLLLFLVPPIFYVHMLVSILVSRIMYGIIWVAVKLIKIVISVL